MKRTRFWLIRHGPVTEHNNTIYGHTDWNCTCTDQEQLQWLVAQLPADAVHIASSLKRTWQTAEALYQSGFSGKVSITDSDLNEQGFGAWEGLTYQQAADQFGLPAQRFWWTPATTRPAPGSAIAAESFIDLYQRVCISAQRICQNHAERDVIVFTHGGTIRAFLALAMGLYSDNTPERLGAVFPLLIQNLSLTQIDHMSYRPNALDPNFDSSQPDTLSEYWQVKRVNALVHRPE